MHANCQRDNIDSEEWTYENIVLNFILDSRTYTKTRNWNSHCRAFDNSSIHSKWKNYAIRARLIEKSERQSKRIIITLTISHRVVSAANAYERIHFGITSFVRSLHHAHHRRRRVMIVFYRSCARDRPKTFSWCILKEKITFKMNKDESISAPHTFMDQERYRRNENKQKKPEVSKCVSTRFSVRYRIAELFWELCIVARVFTRRSFSHHTYRSLHTQLHLWLASADDDDGDVVVVIFSLFFSFFHHLSHSIFKHRSFL